MRTGYVILAHRRLDRAAALARHLSERGSPVVVHVDRRSRIEGDFGRADVISRHAAEWGMMGLVEATLEGSARLLRDHPATAHVMLTSGDSLPVKPLDEFDGFLEDNPGIDFIESVSLNERQWVVDGLSAERFTLWHPFGWRKRRWLFDRNVGLQRRLRIRRKLPKDVQPHLGSQWWCLSSGTLRAILDDPRLPAWRRFFRWSFIPDEGFFQSLVRTVGDPERIAGESLTLARFDWNGQSHAFYDDHADWLAGSDAFFARKIDPDADALYARFLRGVRWAPKAEAYGLMMSEDPFAAARAARTQGIRGIVGAGRFPTGTDRSRIETHRSYGVLHGADAARLDRLRIALADAMPEALVQGRLFAPEGAEFADKAPFGPGNLPAAPILRDDRPRQWLGRLIFAERARLMIFPLQRGEAKDIEATIAKDPNARIVSLDRALPAEAAASWIAAGPEPDIAAIAAFLRGEPGA